MFIVSFQYSYTFQDSFYRFQLKANQKNCTLKKFQKSLATLYVELEINLKYITLGSYFSNCSSLILLLFCLNVI